MRTNAASALERDYQLKVEDHKLAQRDYRLKVVGFWLTVLSLLGTVAALRFGYLQYRKADQWKRAEFLANEMKEFFDHPDVLNVLTMIDWGQRRVNLFHRPDANTTKYPEVTRALQVSALLPHTILTPDGGSDMQVDEEADQEMETSASKMAPAPKSKSKFWNVEARIRDSYDRFLDYLERFGSYLESGLVSKKELDPYLGYWIKDIAAYTDNPDDAAWTCVLLAYIEFYGFENVRHLFGEYSYEISISGPIFEKQSAVMEDQELAKKLREACQAIKR